MSDKENNETDGIRRLITSGAEIAGGAVGGALGFLAGGPSGAALLGAGGAAAAMALKHIGQEASERLLGPREAVRVGGVLALAAGEIRQRLEAGKKPVLMDFLIKSKPGGLTQKRLLKVFF